MKKYKAVCTVTGSEMFGHLIFWVLIIAVSFGLGAPFWLYSLVKLLLNSTELHEIEAAAPQPLPDPTHAAPQPSRQHVMRQPVLVVPKPPV